MTGAMKQITITLLMLIFTSTEANTSANWMQCNETAPGCSCTWINGIKTANCQNASFNDIPQGLSSEISSLILDNNEIPVLRNETFERAGLINLQKLSMKNCRIRDIEKTAFAGLSIIIEINLSNNQIQNLDPSLFARAEKLRVVNLSNNSVETLPDGLFAGFKFLQRIELDGNKISLIGNKTFDNSLKVRNINLNDNQLTYLNKSVFGEFASRLDTLQLKNNPWKCDCRLRDFIKWYVSMRHFNSGSIACKEPKNMLNATWRYMQLDQLVCETIVNGTSQGIGSESTSAPDAAP
ncbi:leucine-rich repeat-containing protein 26-like [Planococcus citri]|uniref:leucine-rich repeat-containing protein 26-like n=1 Tax=Planococcus citri TaxID=170843 RepID=UPI0031F80ED6